MKEKVRYSMCWEDHEMIEALVQPGDCVAMVCSAGDLVLTALSKQPAQVIAVDSNLDQLRLAELKLAALKQFESADFAKVVGLYDQRGAQRQERLSLMKELESSLEKEPCVWMKQHASLLAEGWIHIGLFERYLRQFARYFFALAVRQSTIASFLNATSLEEQKAIYKTGINTALYRFFFKYFFGRYYMRKRGRHPDLLTHVSVAPEQVFYRRMEHAFCEVPIRSNYFLRWILQGCWMPGKEPITFQPSTRDDILQATAVPSFVHSDMLMALNGLEERSLDMVYLSDITETMSQAQANQLFNAAERALKSGGRMVLWNNLVERKPDASWQLDEALTNRFWEQRKVSFYGYLGVFKRT